jgi:hypothetical protein
MRPHAPRPHAPRTDAIQSVIVLETVAELAPKHPGAAVPFKELEAAVRGRLDYRAFTDALNALVERGALTRSAEKPTRIGLTPLGRKQLNEYRSE